MIRLTRAIKKGKLKILHVWDQAGVSCLLALYQRKLGHQADIIIREEYSSGIAETYGLTGQMFFLREKIDKTTTVRRVYYQLPKVMQSFIRAAKFKLRSLRFFVIVMKKAKHYNVLHIHSRWMCIFFVPFKKKIMHWHGDDCRRKPTFKPRLKRWITRLFIHFYSKHHIMYVSTPDLLEEVPNSRWLPNPVDLNHFHKRSCSLGNTACYTHNWYETGEHAHKLALTNGWKLTILDRAAPKQEWIPHQLFPQYLASFEYFIDRQKIHSLSKTALEALALGLKVVQGWDGKIVTKLDPQHHPLTCALRTLKIYRETLI